MTRGKDGGMKVAKTERGWQVLYYSASDEQHHGVGWGTFEDAAAYTTRTEAIEALKMEQDQQRRCDAAERAYASGMSYACGYRD